MILTFLCYLLSSAMAARAASKRQYGWLTWHVLMSVLGITLLFAHVIVRVMK